MLRAYFVQEFDEPEGLAVIAETVREAKQIAYPSGDFSCEWIDMRVRWMRNANIDGLEKGIIRDCLDALRREIYAFIEAGHYPCDNCGCKGELHGYKGKALCSKCYEEAV